MVIKLVKDEPLTTEEEGKVFWSGDTDNYPPDLLEKVFEHVSKKNRKTDNKNIAIGFLKTHGLSARKCYASVQFIDGEYGVQYIFFEKEKNCEWVALGETEIMPSRVDMIKQLDDPTLQWFHL